MRLTLRTLLAYLDDMLEASDAQVIGKKIEESDFAGKLVNRIRDVNRRLRLTAPKVEGKGLCEDANSVAEYLDNTLSAEQQPDFERICLESDVHLAEVAGCHQILTLVLGEAAAVHPDSRRRMYRLVHEGHAEKRTEEAAAAVASAAAVAGAASAPPKPRKKPEVPDYLLEKEGSGLWKVAAALLVLAGLALAVMMLAWPDNPLSVALQGNKQAVNPADKPAPTDVDLSPTKEGANQEGLEKKPADTNPNVSKSETAAENGNTELKPVVDPDSAKPDLTGIDLTKPGEKPEVVKPEVILPVPTKPSETPETKIDPTKLEPTKTDTIKTETKTETVKTETKVDGSSTKTDTKEVVIETKPAVSPNSTKPEVKPTKPEEKGETRESMGRLVSTKQVLLISRSPDNGLHRLGPTQAVAAGDRLLSLPTYRNAIALSAGFTVHLVDGTLVELEANDAKGVPGMKVAYGRLVILTNGKAEARMRVNLGDRAGAITFGNAESTVVIEVRTAVPEGIDPEGVAPVYMVDLFTPNGDVQYDDIPTSKSYNLAAKSRLTLITGRPVVQEADVAAPAWLVGEMSPLEKRASVEMEEGLPLDRPVLLTLRELADHRKSEIQSLAIRSLAYIDEFDLLVRALRQEEQRNSWQEHVEALKVAVSRGAETAKLVHQSFTRVRRDEGDALYRMLLGYTREQLLDDEALRLVNYLSHPDLDFRILAFWNLRNITGQTIGYQPHQSERLRQGPVKRWKERYEAGQIIPREPGTPVAPEEKPEEKS